MLLDMCESVEVDRAGATDHPHYSISLFQQEFRKVRAVLSCDACNQGCFDAVFSGTAVGCMIKPQAGFESTTKVEKSARPKKVVVVGGCFDILHNGHLRFLEKARGAGDVLMVLLESDESVRQMKGANRPINPQKDRAEMLASLRVVDFVVLLNHFKTDKEYDNVINTTKPAIIATTKGDPARRHKERQARLVGAKLKDVVDQIENKSTTRIAALLAKEL